MRKRTVKSLQLVMIPTREKTDGENVPVSVTYLMKWRSKFIDFFEFMR